MTPEQPRDANAKDGKSWLSRVLRPFLGRKERGDVIAANVEEGARGIAIGKNIVQIGAVVIPTFTIPILALLLLIAPGLTFLGWQQLSRPTQIRPTEVLGPTKMQGIYNIAVAQFGEQDAQGHVRPSENGQRLSRWVFEALKNQKGDMLVPT